jgi:hypothetical protein
MEGDDEGTGGIVEGELTWLFRIIYADLAGINEFWRLSALL